MNEDENENDEMSGGVFVPKGQTLGTKGVASLEEAVDLPAIPIITAQGEVNTEWEDFLKEDEVLATEDFAPKGDEDDPSFSCTSSRFWGLDFSSTSNKSRFGMKDSDKEAIVDEQTGAVLMGLKANIGTEPEALKDKELKLAELLEAFGVELSGFMTLIVAAISDTTLVKLDTTEAKNAIWVVPGSTIGTVTQLSFKLELDDAGIFARIADTISKKYDFTIPTIKSPSFQLQRTTLGIPVEGKKYKISSTFIFTVSVKAKGFIFWLKHSPAGLEFTLTEDPDDLGDLWQKISSLGSSDAPSSSVGEPKSHTDSDSKPEMFPDYKLWSLSVGKPPQGPVWFDIKFLLLWETDGPEPVLLGLSYNSQTGTFVGELLFKSAFPDETQRRLPAYDARTEAPNVAEWTDAVEALDDGLELTKVFEGADKLPENIPSIIKQAIFTFTKGKVAKQGQPRVDSLITFSAVITKVPVENFVPVPTSPFNWEQIAVQVSKQGPKFSFTLDTSFRLDPRPADKGKYPPAGLFVHASYSAEKVWNLTGQVNDLSFGLLWGYLEPEFQDPLLAILGKLTLRDLEISYTYNPQGAASSFIIAGAINFGELELRMFYQYTSSKAVKGATAADRYARPGDPKPIPIPAAANQVAWEFECFVGAKNSEATIGSVADSIIDDASESLPDFIKGIKINTTTGGKSPVSLRVRKTPDKKVAFSLQIAISSIEITFIQIATPGLTPVTKKLLRVSVDKIPLIEDIPLVKELPQPFEELIYMWAITPTGFFTLGDVNSINSVLDDSDRIKLKAVTRDANTNDGVTRDSPVTKRVIEAGHHFIVVDGGKVILDHVFNNAKSKPQEKKPRTLVAASAVDAPEGTKTITSNVSNQRSLINTAANDGPEPPPTKGQLTKKTKFLTISSVGLQFKSGYLWVTMDATLELGPIGMTLLGFGIGLPIHDLKLDDLKGLASRVDARINGLGISFDRPPVLMAGVFEHEITQIANGSKESYRGGIAVGFKPYTFVAVGEYSVIKVGTSEYKSVFIFAKLDGPLITFEFATISGVRLGFGYNSMVRSPAIEELPSFPFISDGGTSGVGNNPIKILQALTKPTSGSAPPWVVPKQDSYWLAAGMTITAFEILAITAVAMIAFRDAGVIVSLFANAVAKMPPGPGIPDEALILRIELGMIAEMNFIEGYFRVEAALAPSSFILVPQCQLYGGFGLAYWFGSNPHAGDWVFSVGGYHRSYKPPSHYPVPKRVGISFQIGSNFSITGEAYFAITPKVAMGGAMIHASLDVGPVSAYLDAAFDALINFHPLHYQFDLRISVGVTFSLDILFVHIHISCHVGADLHIEGPEFGGVAHVDFYLFAFNVYFGADNEEPPPISLDAFWAIAHQPGPGSPPPPKSDPNPLVSVLEFQQLNKTPASPVRTSIQAGAGLKLALEDGVFPMPARDSNSTDVASAGSGSKWFVKGGTFRFRVACDFALSSATITNQGNVSPTPAPIFSKPMHVSKPITSSLIITITRLRGKKIIVDWDEVSFVTKPVPLGLWGAYSRDSDPMHARGDAKNSLLSPSAPTTDLAMGVSIHSPPPRLAVSKIPAFNATAAQKQEVLDFRTETKKGTSWILDRTFPEQKSFLPLVVSAEDEKETNEVKWKETREGWAKSFDKEIVLGEKPGEGLVALCMQSLGWDKPSPEVLEREKLKTKKSWMLDGSLPSKLVGGLEEFYLALPRASGVVDVLA